jgi:hypothetical protein
VLCTDMSVENAVAQADARHTATSEVLPATICPSHTSQCAAASPNSAIDSMKVSWYVANVLVTIGTGCRAQAAVYRTNRKGSRCPSQDNPGI